MKYLLIMSFSGSTMTVIYMLLRCMLRDKMSARMQYLLAKAAILYYLIPLPFVRRWYEKIGRYILPEKGAKAVHVSLVWDGYTVYANGKSHFTNYFKIQLIVIFLWILFSFLILLIKVLDYTRTRKQILRYADSDRENSCFEYLKRKCGLKRRIALYRSNAEGGTMSFGVFKPVIWYNRGMEETDAELILCHELIHIKRWDILWKILKQISICLHWWNPVAWILYYDFDRICEWSCDEIVVQGKGKEERKRYARLLIKESTKEKHANSTRLRFGMNFENAGAAGRLEKRMANIMKMKKWNRIIAGIVSMLLILTNSLTVFAYSKQFREFCEDSVSQEIIDAKLAGTDLQFIPDGMDKEQLGDGFIRTPDIEEIKYDLQFTDEAGNIYQISDTEPTDTYAACDHTYVSGKINKHIKKSDGGCTVEEYSGKQCSKCGNWVTGSKVSEFIYAVCPHG